MKYINYSIKKKLSLETLNIEIEVQLDNSIYIKNKKLLKNVLT